VLQAGTLGVWVAQHVLQCMDAAEIPCSARSIASWASQLRSTYSGLAAAIFAWRSLADSGSRRRRAA
jgi:hypothetical protein